MYDDLKAIESEASALGLTAYADHAASVVYVFVPNGADSVLECDADDVPHECRSLDDFRALVLA